MHCHYPIWVDEIIRFAYNDLIDLATLNNALDWLTRVGVIICGQYNA